MSEHSASGLQPADRRWLLKLVRSSFEPEPAPHDSVASRVREVPAVVTTTAAPPLMIARVLRPFQRFAQMEASGGILLLVCTAIALAWANSPWAESYHHLWELTVTLGAPVCGSDESPERRLQSQRPQRQAPEGLVGAALKRILPARVSRSRSITG